jgi:DNA-binding NarL/FixJ family response regulator
LRVFIVDVHPIFRRGLASALEGRSEVEVVGETGSIVEAVRDERLETADVVVFDHDVPGGLDFIRHVRGTTSATVLICSMRCGESELLAAVQAGATGFLSKTTLTPDALFAGVSAGACGAGVMAPELLRPLLDGFARISRDVLEPRGLSVSRLTTREQQVLRLIAEGHATREVARELSYSERTVKSIVHDVVMKLDARSRSHAVAHAVRDGLI